MTKHLAAIAVAALAMGWPTGLARATTATTAIKRTFRGHEAQARCIARHESGMDPTAVSPTDDHGLFQINASWFGKVVRWRGHVKHIQRRWILNPLYNAQVAWIISRGGTDWWPWATYSVHGNCR